MSSPELFIRPSLLLSNTSLPAPFFVAVAGVKNGGYLTPALFLKQLQTVELQQAINCMFVAQVDSSVYAALSLVVALMANHEGLVVEEDDRIRQWMTSLLLLLQLELHSRAGRVVIDYSKVTLDFRGLDELPLAPSSPVQKEDISLLKLEGDGDVL